MWMFYTLMNDDAIDYNGWMMINLVLCYLGVVAAAYMAHGDG
jgi:hypothetical protein